MLLERVARQHSYSSPPRKPETVKGRQFHALTHARAGFSHDELIPPVND